MSMKDAKGGDPEGSDPPPDVDAPGEAEKKPVGRIAIKKKPSRPPWAMEPIREVSPDALAPVDPEKEDPG